MITSENAHVVRYLSDADGEVHFYLTNHGDMSLLGSELSGLGKVLSVCRLAFEEPAAEFRHIFDALCRASSRGDGYELAFIEQILLIGHGLYQPASPKSVDRRPDPEDFATD